MICHKVSIDPVIVPSFGFPPYPANVSTCEELTEITVKVSATGVGLAGAGLQRSAHPGTMNQAPQRYRRLPRPGQKPAGEV